VLQDLAGVESILTKAYTTLQSWFEYVILSIQQYIPKA